MPLGVVNDDEFNREVINSGIPSPKVEERSEVITGIVEDLPKKGRGEGSVEVPDSLRKIIGETNELEGRKSAIEFAKSFGISPSSVSAYANGSTSTASYNNPRESIVNHIQGRKDKIANSALSILRKSFSVINEDEHSKLRESTAKELSTIAKEMASVVKMMEPESDKLSENRPQFVVFAPIMKDESHFEVITLKE